MREFLKGVCVVTLLAATVASALAWIPDRPSALTWALRFTLPSLSAAALVGFLVIHLRRDEVPDYLYKCSKRYFDRNGFCFTVGTSVRDGTCYFELYFQNRHERPCVGRVAARPARGFFRRPKLDAVTFEVHAQGAAFGVARVPVPLPRDCQGKRMKFEIGASVEYPNGKGRMLRFRNGIALRTDSKLRNSFGTALTVAGAMGGMLVLSSPASAIITLPSGVADDLLANRAGETRTIWKLGDPPLQQAA